MDEIKIKTELDPDYNELPERPLKRIKLESGEGKYKLTYFKVMSKQ